MLQPGHSPAPHCAASEALIRSLLETPGGPRPRAGPASEAAAPRTAAEIENRGAARRMLHGAAKVEESEGGVGVAMSLGERIERLRRSLGGSVSGGA
jgi:hypothetical protein